jgi:hypothetical protein
MGRVGHIGNVRVFASVVLTLVLSGCGVLSGDENAYELYTHCGIQHLILGQTVYLADPVQEDGNGNPPAGWDNPLQKGSLTVREDGTATFVAKARDARELRADFVRSDLQISDLPICS